ncbi:MAG: RNA polymerase sigma factor RpoD/SigA [Bacteroidota bacterium]
MRALKITNSITRRDERSLEKYLTEISRYEVLTPEEEVALFQQIREGNEAAVLKVVMHNLRFVVSVAKQYQNMGLWLGDLINEGNIGLMKAARRFDETRGFKFISYAVWWIRQSILQAINEKSNNIRLPLNLRSITSKVVTARNKFLQQNEREPSLEELAEMTELTVEKVQTSLENYKKNRSLDAPINHEGDYAMIDVMADKSMKAPDHSVQVEESRKKEVQQLLNTLPARQAKIVELYYGIGHKYPYSLSDIGDHVGVSRERVRQIRDKAIRKLRKRMDAKQVSV